MNARRRANMTVAATDGAFALSLFGCGYFDAPIELTALAAFGMLAYWSWSRRAVLNRLRGAAWYSQTGIAVLVILAIVSGSYWLGLGVGGRI